MEERWRPVVGYEGHYDISDHGRIRSWKNWHSSPPKLLATPSDSDGYKIVTLSLDGVRTTHKMHRLVLEAFVGPMPDGMVTRHLDGNRSNNLLANIVYGTPAENSRDRIEHGNGPKIQQTCRRGHPRDQGSGTWCVVCRKESEQRQAAKRKAERAAAPPPIHPMRAKTHCKNGHEFTPENTQISQTKTGWRRHCRTCNAAAAKRYLKRKKALAAPDPRETKD